ncbi:flagellar hook-basal body complex protein [Caminibacter pacificus]
MTTSFYNSIAGLMSFQQGIDVWGDNIANINTIGFKEKTPDFSTIFSTTLVGTQSSDTGMGSTITSTSLDTSQGSIINTENPFDLAIGGNGWFGVKHGNQTFYTRNGAFNRDAQGYLVNDSGDYLLVANANNLIKQDDGSYIVDSTKQVPDILNAKFTPISLPDNVILPAVATKNVNLTSNLNDDTQITTTKPATENLYFSALYNKDGVDMQIRDSQNLVFGFGNDVKYDSGILSSTFCIANDEKDGKDVNIDFTLNGKEIKFTLPDGTTSKDILQKLSSELTKNGFENKVSNNAITIKTPNEFILKSNDNIMQSTAAAVLTYKTDPKNQYDFSTPKDFAEKLKSLADVAYPNETKIGFENGEFYISNIGHKTINAFANSANNSNEKFLNNLDRLGNVIIPQTDAKSLKFLSNTQDFGGNIIEANGNKDTITFEFTKQKVQPDKITWLGNIKITNENGEVTNLTKEFVFDSNGALLSPKTITLNEPQQIDINFNLTSYAKPDKALSYSFNQDGIEKGYLQHYQIEQNGNIIATFSNARQAVLGQIPIFHFQNDQGLDSVGGNLFTPTSNSKEAFLYQNNGEYIQGAQILSGSLENSNVSMTTAMTELIITQKAFSASAKTVTTSDEMIQKAINLKR